MFTYNVKVEIGNYEYLVDLLSKAKGIEKDTGLIQKVTSRGLEILKEEAGNVSFVTTSNENYVNSMQSKIESYVTGVLYSTSDHAAYNEFGTGVVGLGDVVPDATMTGMSYKDGWHYFDKDKNRWRYTRGQKRQFVFYKTILRLQKEIPNLVLEYVDNYLRQIGG